MELSRLKLSCHALTFKRESLCFVNVRICSMHDKYSCCILLHSILSVFMLIAIVFFGLYYLRMQSPFSTFSTTSIKLKSTNERFHGGFSFSFVCICMQPSCLYDDVRVSDTLPPCTTSRYSPRHVDRVSQLDDRPDYERRCAHWGRGVLRTGMGLAEFGRVVSRHLLLPGYQGNRRQRH